MDTLLLVDDDLSLLDSLKMYFEERSSVSTTPFEVSTATSGTEALHLVQRSQPSIILLDMMLPDFNGLELLPELKKLSQPTPIVVATAFHDMATTIKAMKAGAFDYVHKPFVNISALDDILDRALRVRDASQGAIPAPNNRRVQLGDIVAVSEKMQSLLKEMGKTAAASKATVLIHGESGTGKERIAQVIHTYSNETERPFMGINCSAIVPTLLESELFGHERGAFTGAHHAKPGKFELAADGTVFLDEIGDMSLMLQAKLLRVLQEREFERVGSSKRIELQARVVAATHRDLAAEVASGRFREDLYQRLQVVRLELPPLRERREDIPALVHHLLARINAKVNKSVTHVSPEVMAQLIGAPWRGNVRELENVLTHAVVRASGQVLVAVEMPTMSPSATEHPRRRHDDTRPVPSLEEAEREVISRAWRHSSGHKGQMCQVLGISRPTLDRKLKKFGIAHDA